MARRPLAASRPQAASDQAVQTAQEGSHAKWRHTLVPETEVVIAGHDGDDAKAYQEKQVRELLRKIAEAKRRVQP